MHIFGRMEGQDPHMSGTRYHTTIFVETEPVSGEGHVHHVVGDITSRKGMSYDCKDFTKPELSKSFNSKEFLGYADAATYPDQWDPLLRSLPTPPQQKAFNTQTMATEPFKTLDPLTFYEPGETRRPLIKCTEWSEQTAIPALRQAGLILSNESSEPSG